MGGPLLYEEWRAPGTGPCEAAQATRPPEAAPPEGLPPRHVHWGTNPAPQAVIPVFSSPSPLTPNSSPSPEFSQVPLHLVHTSGPPAAAPFRLPSPCTRELPPDPGHSLQCRPHHGHPLAWGQHLSAPLLWGQRSSTRWLGRPFLVGSLLVFKPQLTEALSLSGAVFLLWPWGCELGPSVLVTTVLAIRPPKFEYCKLCEVT